MRADLLQVVNAFHFSISPCWAQVHWHTKKVPENTNKSEGVQQSITVKNCGRQRIVHQSTQIIPLTQSHPVNMDPSELNPEICFTTYRILGQCQNFFFMLALSGAQSNVKGRQIDPPSGSCLASTICGTYDELYVEKLPIHRLRSVSWGNPKSGKSWSYL